MTNKGKLIVIAGTDSSGKETQTSMLVSRLAEEGISVSTMSFPRYETATGKIVGGPYLGKEEISESWFPDGPDSVEPEVASLYYAADRRAAREELIGTLELGTNIVLDRYISANMGHQGGKRTDPDERAQFYQWIDDLEYGLLDMPRPDQTIFLYVPTWKSIALQKTRSHAPDGHESNHGHIHRAEQAYRQLADIYNWTTINCLNGGNMRSKEDIHEEVFSSLNLE